MDWRRRFVCVGWMVLAAALGGCVPRGTARPPSRAVAVAVNPCRGRELTLNDLPKSCEHERPDESAPPSNVLQLSLEPPSAGIPSGGSSVVWLRFRNVSAGLLSLHLNSMCGGLFSVELLSEDGSRRVDLVEEVGGLGLCGTVPGVRVELEPGGTLSQRFTVPARKQRYVEAQPEGLLELADAGPIAPGRYLMRVALPLYSDHRLGWEGRMYVAALIRVVANGK